ncbi:response regulator transcription factor [Streptomyces sp. NPDC057403]|uniref:response regulator transcription factor n=1 Tax=Streptomyces sp. NPDC057403 TaxID=3346119 RepID=UPI0036B46E12
MGSNQAAPLTVACLGCWNRACVDLCSERLRTDQPEPGQTSDRGIVLPRGSRIEPAVRQNTEHEEGERHSGLPNAPRWVLEADLSLLTVRESEVLVALGDCLSNPAIADLHYITERTVKKHVASIFCKLGISSRAEAAVVATYRKGELCAHGVLSATSSTVKGMTPSDE